MNQLEGLGFPHTMAKNLKMNRFFEYRLLQVCLFGHWSYVCGDALQERDENVVLNQLGCSSETGQHCCMHATAL